MSRRVKSTHRPKGRGFGRGYPQALVKVEELEEGPPIEAIEGKNVTPGQESKDEGASAFPGPSLEAAQQELAEQGPSLEAAQQELAEPKTGLERGDGPDVEGKELPNPEPMKMLEAGEGKPQI